MLEGFAIPMIVAGLCVALGAAQPAAAQTSKATAKVHVAKASDQKVTYHCLQKKSLEVTYRLSAKGVPTSAKVALDDKTHSLKAKGKANQYTVNLGKDGYTLSLDKTKLPVTKAPIMIFKNSKASVSSQLKKAKAGVQTLLPTVSQIIFKNCYPAGVARPKSKPASKPQPKAKPKANPKPKDPAKTPSDAKSKPKS